MMYKKIYRILVVLIIVTTFFYPAVTSAQTSLGLSYYQRLLSIIEQLVSNLRIQAAAILSSQNSSLGNTSSNISGYSCSNYQFHWGVSYAGSINLNSYPHIVSGRVHTINDIYGIYPHFNYAGQAVNGGIPQTLDLNAHKLKFKQDLGGLIDSNYDGMVIFDYESWPPQWDLLWETSPNTNPYKVASINLVRSQHPTWTEVEIIAEAKRQWEEAAINFYLATIEAAREIRPRAKLGAFDLMYHSYYTPYSSGPGSAQSQAYDDQLAVIWQKLDVIVVDIYQFFPSFGNGVPPTGVGAPPAPPPGHEAWYDENKQYVRENIWEGKRLGGIYGKTVIAYAWPRYHNSEPHAYELLRSADLFLSLLYPLELGADGVVIWDYFTSPNPSFENYIYTVLGPMIEEYCNPTTTTPPPLSPQLPTLPPTQPITNQPPAVNAGADQNVSLSMGATLTGMVSDDGKPNPPGATSLTWSKASGPGSVVFSSPNNIFTNATFSSTGTYVLNLTVSDGALSASDSITVVVNSNPPTPEELAVRIQQLQEIIRILRALIARLSAQPSTGYIPSSTSAYNLDLTLGSTGPAVTALQKYLVSANFLKMPPGVSYGTFGPLTKSALAKFQSAHLIYPANGYYGPVTRKLVNQLRGQ